MLGGQSMGSGLDGERKSMAYAAGGVFSGTLQSTQPPRSIMTAQGGARSTNRAYGPPRGRQAAAGTGEKRGLTSQQPSGLPGMRPIPVQGRTLATSSGRPSHATGMHVRPGGPYQS